MASSAVTVGGNRDDVVGHQAARRIVGVGQQLADVVGLGGFHAAEQIPGALRLEIAEDVRGVVRLHLLEDVGGAFGLHAADERELQVGADLLKRVGGRLVVQRVQHLVYVVLVELRDDLGDVRGVQLGQVFVGNLELHAGRS